MSPTFSPDGKQVAFSWDGEKGDNEDLYVVMVGADNPLPITGSCADVSAAWKPDGSQLRLLEWNPVGRRFISCRRWVARNKYGFRRFMLGFRPVKRSIRGWHGLPMDDGWRSPGCSH